MLSALLITLITAQVQSVPRAASQSVRPSDRQEPQQRTSLLRTPKKDPYASLFRSRPIGRQTVSYQDLNHAGAAAARNDRVVCGMLLHEVDPKMDAKIKLPPPDATVEHAVRRLRPSVCTQ
jgi:hypothetical protein